MSRETLLDAIAGREAEAFDRTIDVYIGRLRRKIAADPKQPSADRHRSRRRVSARCPAEGPANRQSKAVRCSDEAAIHAGAGILASHQ
jgi:hypothetical protein